MKGNVVTSEVRRMLVLGALLAGLSVAAGAFGAHGLRSFVATDQLANWEVAARYQMYHALAIILVAWMSTHWPNRSLLWAGRLFLVGIAIFSGMLYTLVISGQKILGAIVPIGGVAFLIGWGLLAYGLARSGDE